MRATEAVGAPVRRGMVTISIMLAQYAAKTTALEISISWFYLGLFVGSTGMLIFHLYLMIRTFRNPTDLETLKRW